MKSPPSQYGSILLPPLTTKTIGNVPSSDSCTTTTTCIIACYLLLFLDTFALFEARPIMGGLNRVSGNDAEVYKVAADCASYGVDFANGGSYNIDGSSNENFSFTTIFQGCSEESITPVLRDSNENSYGCSPINTTPEGTSVTSSCGIPYSQMWTGQWRIILSGRQIAVQRVINLTVGKPETVVVTHTGGYNCHRNQNDYSNIDLATANYNYAVQQAYVYRHHHANTADCYQDINGSEDRNGQDRNELGVRDRYEVGVLPLPHVQDHDGQVAPVAAGDRQQRQAGRHRRARRAAPDQGARAAGAHGFCPTGGDNHHGHRDDVHRHAHEHYDAACGDDDGDVD
ncbi:hypothetical protein PG985_010936 [Apiospora marii]|uniref:Ig-like domain-containing protein n=1 Tax=Apiospora marii TaxID=335849 RepID=A0ABR1SS95_9PEZI